MNNEPTQQPSSDRGPGGRFLKGHGVRSPGRPRRETEAEYIGLIIAECTPAKWRKIIERAIEDATNGDHKARTWLSNYICGRPAERLEIDMGDTETLRFAGTSPEEIDAVIAARLAARKRAKEPANGENTKPGNGEAHA